MALIFSASSDRASGHRSSRIIGPIVRWLVPNISQQSLEKVVHAVRKMAHVTEYAILALLLWRALRTLQTVPSVAGRLNPAEPLSWRWPVAIGAFALAVLYAITDEFHQSFVPTREGQAFDVLIDSVGAALGLFALWLFGRWRKYW
jgi:VanZ family protein